MRYMCVCVFVCMCVSARVCPAICAMKPVPLSNLRPVRSKYLLTSHHRFSCFIYSMRQFVSLKHPTHDPSISEMDEEEEEEEEEEGK